MKGPNLPDMHSPSVRVIRQWVEREIVVQRKTLEQPRLEEIETTLVRGRLEVLRAIQNSVSITDSARTE